jgi:hypothetical protein
MLRVTDWLRALVLARVSPLGGGSASAGGKPGTIAAIRHDARAPIPPMPPRAADTAAGALTEEGQQSLRQAPADSVFVLPPEAVFPYDWHEGRHDFGAPPSARARAVHGACSACCSNPTFDRERCKELVAGEGTFAISYWTHSWQQEQSPWYEWLSPAGWFLAVAGPAIVTLAAAVRVCPEQSWRCRRRLVRVTSKVVASTFPNALPKPLTPIPL